MSKSNTAILILLIAVFLGLPFKDASAAFNTSDLRSLNSQTPFYSPGDSNQASCGTAVGLTGSEITEQIYNHLINKGLTPPQAAGIMGNLEAESSMNPRAVEDKKGQPPRPDSDVMEIGTSYGYGLAQWTTKGRQVGLHEAAVAAGKQDSDLLVQLEYLWKEMGSDQFYENGFARLKETSDVKVASSLFMLHFERPLDQSQSKQNARAALGLKWLTKYGSSTPTQSSSAPPVVSRCGAAGGNNPTNGGYSLPTTVDFYEKNTVQFTKDHHLNYRTGAQSPGSDIEMPKGTIIYSMSDGVIKRAPNGTIDKKTGGYGLGVTVDAGNGIEFIYGHGIDGGSYPGAKQGDTVKAGQPIMTSDTTGSSTGPHLHLSIVVDGKHRCPQTFFTGIYSNKIPEIRTLPALGCSSAV